MKVLITGACGQLGKEWVEFCEKKGLEYSSYCSDELNIQDEAALREIVYNEAPTALINCAAYTKVDQAEDEQALAYKVNADALGPISKVCTEHNIKLIHYSTDYVFNGKMDDYKKFPEGYPEDHQTDPQNVYGISKRKGEKVIENSGCQYLILRVSWLCGRHGNNFIKTMLKLGSEKKSLRVVNDQFGSPTFAHQVVEQTYHLLQNQNEGVFHLTSSGVTNWHEFAIKIFHLSGLDVEVEPVPSSEYPTRARRPYFSKLSTEKISTIPDIKIISWQEGLKEFLTTIY